MTTTDARFRFRRFVRHTVLPVVFTKQLHLLQAVIRRTLVEDFEVGIEPVCFHMTNIPSSRFVAMTTPMMANVDIELKTRLAREVGRSKRSLIPMNNVLYESYYPTLKFILET
jgi:hypothetical protein